MRREIYKNGLLYQVKYNETDAVGSITDTGVYRFTPDTVRVFSMYKTRDRIKLYEDKKGTNKYLLGCNSIAKISTFIEKGLYLDF